MHTVGMISLFSYTGVMLVVYMSSTLYTRKSATSDNTAFLVVSIDNVHFLNISNTLLEHLKINIQRKLEQPFENIQKIMQCLDCLVSKMFMRLADPITQ